MVHTRLASSAVQQHYGFHPCHSLCGRGDKVVRVSVYCQSPARQVLLEGYQQTETAGHRDPDCRERGSRSSVSPPLCTRYSYTRDYLPTNVPGHLHQINKNFHRDCRLHRKHWETLRTSASGHVASNPATLQLTVRLTVLLPGWKATWTINRWQVHVWNPRSDNASSLQICYFLIFPIKLFLSQQTYPE